MSGPRAILDGIAPIRTPERVAWWLSLVAAAVIVVVVTPSLLGWIPAGLSRSPEPSAATSQSPRPSSAASTGLPLADLGSVATIEERLAGLASSLRDVTEASSPSVGTIVSLMRQVNATLVAGSGAVEALVRVPATERLGEDLAAAHTGIGTAISATFARNLSDSDAYESGAREVADLIDALAPLDAEVGDLLAGD